MGVKVKYENKGLKNLAKRINGVDGMKVRAGVLGFDGNQIVPGTELTYSELAAIQEFGIPRGPRNPAIPARPAMRRVAFSQRQDGPLLMAKAMQPYLSAVTRPSENDPAKRLSVIGFDMASAIVDSYETSRSWAKPNASETIEKKGFNFPLTETGKLKSSVSFQVVDRTGNVRAQGKG